MKIVKIETLFCDAGWRPWIFFKVTTDEGLVGYSEVTDSHGSPRGLRGIVKDLEPLLIGRDPRPVETIFWDLYRATRQSPGGVIQKAIGGIENALLDIKAKALGIPVYELFGGPTRDGVRVYWSHCGTTRARAWEVTQTPKLASYDDVASLGREVVDRGFTALKTNIVIPGENPSVPMQGFQGGSGTMDQNCSREIIEALERLLTAFRKGGGEKLDLIVDLNFNFKSEGNLKIARALEPFELFWLEIDCFDPAALAYVRKGTNLSICSGENVYTTRGFRPFFEQQSMDIASVDVIWNGFAQSKKIADLAETHEINVAPHNYYSHMATFISAHFCASIPNVRILEVDIDDVPWKDELVTEIPLIENGYMSLPTGPGWGLELNEDVIKKHPWPKMN
jgi:L-alanine-DL-glutamate epimerase-like enolase superfamily enzyme